MTLNASGPISLGGSTTGQSIAVELGLSPTGQISLNDTTVRNLAGVASGTIIMPTNFWGKSNLAIFGNGSNGALSISTGTLSSGQYTTVNISGSVICGSPTIIYAKGDVTISGTLSVRYGQTGTATMQIVRKPGTNTSAPSSSFTAINPDETAISAAGGTLQQVVQTGGTGGNGVGGTYAPGGTGSNSTTGCGGGGGGGGCPYTGSGNSGAQGTSFGGGGGGGGGAVAGSAGAGYGSNGGNGARVSAGYNRGGGGGGAGYPTAGTGGSNAGGYSGPGLAGENLCGGVLWIICGGNVTVTSTGVITAKGGTGGTCGGGNGGNEGGGGGGGSGGGAIRILYKGTYTNSGSVIADGGNGSSGRNGGNNPGGQGGAGGAGSIATFQVVT